MTRETKVGLVVAGSFVCLVSVVVWQKMKKSTDDTTPVTIAVAPNNPQPNPDPKANPQGDPKKDGGVQQAALQIPNPLQLDPKTPVKEFGKDLLPPPLLENKDPVVLPKIDKDQGTPPELPDFGKNQTKSPEDEIEAMLKKAAQLPGNPKELDKKLPTNEQFVQAQKEDKNKGADLLPPPPLVPNSNDSKDKVIAKDKDQLPPPPMVDLKDLLLPPAANNPTKDPVQPNLGGEPKKDVNIPPPLGDPKKELTIPPPLGDPKKDLLPPPLTNLPKDLPPLGFKDPPPPIKNTNAKVEFSQAETYFVQELDTLAQISQKGYGSEKYAQAILAYNSKYNPEANVRSSLSGDRPQLFKGMALVLPTREFLASRYGHLIQDNQPNQISPVSIQVGNQNPNAKPQVKANTPDPTRRYRVPDQGLHIFEIARQQLGNANRWSEILRLNPSLRTEYPIPGGTELQMPAN